MRYLEIRRHTDNDGDQLTAEGVAAAQEIGRTGPHPPYSATATTTAGRMSCLGNAGTFRMCTLHANMPAKP